MDMVSKGNKLLTIAGQALSRHVMPLGHNMVSLCHNTLNSPHPTSCHLLRSGWIPSGRYAASLDDVIKWKHFSRCWTFVRVIRRWPVKSPHKCHRRGSLMFSLICAWTKGCANNLDVGDLRRHRVQNDVTVMWWLCSLIIISTVVQSQRQLKPITLVYVK